MRQNSSCAGPTSFASPAARRDSGTTLPFRMSPWFRPGIQLQSCSEQTNGVPTPRRHPRRRFSNGFLPKPLHKVQNGQVNQRTAGGRAYSFAWRGTSAVCLDVYKVRRLRANSLQICAKRELLKNNLVTAEGFAGSLDNHYTWHSNRHTFCSWLAMAGVSIKEIQVLAGHKTISMSARYAHLSPEVTASASERLVQPQTTA